MELPSVLFVCLGNICRSPLAEAAFRREAARRRFEVVVDSAGTGSWHIGNPPDPRAIAEAARHGIDITSYRARQVTSDDFARFDRIVAMDGENLARLMEMCPANGRASLSLLLDHVPGRAGEPVADPYFGGPEGFERTWREVEAGAKALVEEML
jgi:protein-tyrosine phosphatase